MENKNSWVLDRNSRGHVQKWDFSSYWTHSAFCKGEKIDVIRFETELSFYYVSMRDYLYTPDRKAQFDKYLTKCGADVSKWKTSFVNVDDFKKY